MGSKFPGEQRILQCKEVEHDFTCVTGLILATLSEEKVKARANFLSVSWGRLSVSKVDWAPLEKGSSQPTAVIANLKFATRSTV